MAGTNPPGSQKTQENDCSFQWDDDSQLYFHASSGFYHDPNNGWYYSSRDGLYYTFENGSYVLLEPNKSKEFDAYEFTGMVSDESIQGKPCSTTSDGAENPAPPSEWLEETLFDLYLMGYSNSAINVNYSSIDLVRDGVTGNIGNEIDPDRSCSERLPGSCHGLAFEEIEEGEWIPEDVQDAESSGRVLDEDYSWDEENWRAQYGQVVQSVDEAVPAFSVVDLWDWALVAHPGKNKKHQVARLIGRLVRRSSKLHPSVPAGGGLLKTAAICEVHLDLVRVSSGQVYRLRSPSSRYLASLSTFDSSNPTKDWAFPDLLITIHDIPSSNIKGGCRSENSNGVTTCKDSSATAASGLLSVSEKNRSHSYRDRAAERRTLHGGFGIGPGQKNLVNDNVDEISPSSISIRSEEAAAEAMNLSFGAGSYARRLLENMGWKEGEALGNSTKGLIEPLQAVGNKGNAGLGWNHDRF